MLTTDQALFLTLYMHHLFAPLNGVCRKQVHGIGVWSNWEPNSGHSMLRLRHRFEIDNTHLYTGEPGAMLSTSFTLPISSLCQIEKLGKERLRNFPTDWKN